MCKGCDFEAVELPGTCCPTHGQPLVSPALRSRPPIDERYVLVDRLDEGAFAEVFLAFDRQPPAGESNLVALKLLKHDQRGAEVRARFRREGEMLRRLVGHPGIVGLRGQRHDGEVQYLALEYVDGINLERLIAERRRLPAVKAARVVMAVLDVLEHLHERGVIHRDLKPNNIMVQAIGDGPEEPTTVRLLDLGIARRIDEENAMLPLITRRGWTVGTPFYMAPEQFDDSQVDARADIYAAGVVLFHLLSGHAPFQGSGHQVAQKHRGAPIPELDKGLEVPVAVESTMRRAMAKAPERRYGTARLMCAALGAAIGQPAEAPPRSTSRMRSAMPDGPGPTYENDTLEVTDPELLQAVAAVSAARATMSTPVGAGRDLMQNAPRRSVMPLPSRPTASAAASRRGSSTARLPSGAGSVPGSDVGVPGVAGPTPALRRSGTAMARGTRPRVEEGASPPPAPAHPPPPSMPTLASPGAAPRSRTTANERKLGAPIRAVATRPEARPPGSLQSSPVAADGAMEAPVVGVEPMSPDEPTHGPPAHIPLGAGLGSVAEPSRGRGPIPWARAFAAAAVALVLGLVISWVVGGADGVVVWSSTPAAATETTPVAAVAAGLPAAAGRIRAFRAMSPVPEPEVIDAPSGSITERAAVPSTPVARIRPIRKRTRKPAATTTAGTRKKTRRGKRPPSGRSATGAF